MASSETACDRVEHLWILALAVLAITGSFALQPSNTEGLELPIPACDITVSLPDTCMSRRLFGMSCPGCGLTRSFVAVSHGDLGAAFRHNSMGPFLYLLCWLQIPYRVGEYLGVSRYSSVWSAMNRHMYLITWGVLAGLLLSWGVGMTPW